MSKEIVKLLFFIRVSWCITQKTIKIGPTCSNKSVTLLSEKNKTPNVDCFYFGK